MKLLHKMFWKSEIIHGQLQNYDLPLLVGGLVAIFGIVPEILGISSSQEGWPNHQPVMIFH